MYIVTLIYHAVVVRLFSHSILFRFRASHLGLDGIERGRRERGRGAVEGLRTGGWGSLIVRSIASFQLTVNVNAVGPHN